MSVAQFTPGPWRVDEGEGRVYRYANAGEHAARIEAISRGSSMANANLIAAAPELYSALVEATDLLEMSGYSTLEMRTALAKARGEA